MKNIFKNFFSSFITPTESPATKKLRALLEAEDVHADVEYDAIALQSDWTAVGEHISGATKDFTTQPVDFKNYKPLTAQEKIRAMDLAKEKLDLLIEKRLFNQITNEEFQTQRAKLPQFSDCFFEK